MNIYLDEKDFKSELIYDSTFKGVIMKEFESLLKINEDSRLVLDFSTINRINIDVLVQLLALGLKAKESKVAIEIILNYLPDLRNFLINSGFMKASTSYNLFDFLGDENIAAATNSDTDKSKKIIRILDKQSLIDGYLKKYRFIDTENEKDKIYRCLEIELIGEEILNNLNKSVKITEFDKRNNKNGTPKYTEYGRVISEIVVDDKNIVSYRKVHDMLYTIIEVLHNALFHGSDKCCVGFQVYSKESGKVIEIAISDLGKGFYKELCKKVKYVYTEDKEKFLSYMENDLFIPKVRRNYFSIYEALMFRKKYKQRGLYDVCKDIITMGNAESYMQIKNNNVQLKLGAKTIKDFIISDYANYDEISFFINDLIEIIKYGDAHYKVDSDANVLYNYLNGTSAYIYLRVGK